MKLITLTQVLQKTNARLELDRKWLVWDDADNLWKVYQQAFGEKVKIICQTDSLERAIESLTEG